MARYKNAVARNHRQHRPHGTRPGYSVGHFTCPVIADARSCRRAHVPVANGHRFSYSPLRLRGTIAMMKSRIDNNATQLAIGASLILLLLPA